MRFVSVTGDMTRSTGADLGWLMVVSAFGLSLPTAISISHRHRGVLLTVAVGIFAAVSGMRCLPWEQWGHRALLLWPLLAVAGLALTSALTPRGDIASLSGVIALAFLYIGMTQPKWTGVAFLPVAVGARPLGGGRGPS